MSVLVSGLVDAATATAGASTAADPPSRLADVDPPAGGRAGAAVQRHRLGRARDGVLVTVWATPTGRGTCAEV